MNCGLFSPPLDQYPSSSHCTHKWDKMVVDLGEEEKNEKLEGDAALNKLFQQIYSDGSDEVKRAMNKSFVSVTVVMCFFMYLLLPTAVPLQTKVMKLR